MTNNLLIDMRNILDCLSIGVVVCQKSKIICINHYAKELFGTDKPFTSKELSDIWYTEDNLTQDKQIFLNGKYYNEIIIPYEIDGDQVQIYVFKDISEEVQAKERARQLESYLDALKDIGILAIDRHETIQYANKTSIEKKGIACEEIIGGKFLKVFPETRESAILQTLKTQTPVENRQMIHSINQELCSSYPVYQNGEFIGAVSVLLFSRWINSLLNATASLQIEYREKAKTGTNQHYSFSDILGQDSEMKKAKKLASRVCNVPSPVLICGETGTGKELFAQSIHNGSAKHQKPFIGINCAAIPETLLESTLFGTEKGAFTGAVTSAGIIEQAEDGTLFLDEINSMPVELQVKLLRVLQERSYRRVGGRQEKKLNCRILSACNRPPKECIAVGSLREDLYYRLAAVQLDIPPLRKRNGDSILLAENAINNFSEIYGIHPTLSKEVKTAFLNYNWPGNVRELNHVIESIMILLDDQSEITLDDLPDTLRICAAPYEASIELGDVNQTADRNGGPLQEEGALKGALAEYERNNIILALQKNNYNVSKTAKELGYTRSNLQYRMSKLHIKIRKSKE